MKFKIIIFAGLLLNSASGFANEANVIGVKTHLNSDQSYRFDVTIKHNDDGWSHYVNKWEILSPSGKVIATRVLQHPHEVQPFTRSLYHVKIPKEMTHVRVRAYDSVHHYGGLEQDVNL